ncbi:hypothetical protein [Lysinibacillus sp. FSL L8-0126]|uniref:hypothetical protein n=1 Tax=Lysinibacillus sp. FSL L8-0126 TaxID=2921515 RepID=UPI00315AA2D4
MQLDQLKSHIKNKFNVNGHWIKDREGNDDYELLIVPKGLMPDVDLEIRKNGFVTIDKGSWVEDENYLVIQILK